MKQASIFTNNQEKRRVKVEALCLFLFLRIKYKDFSTKVSDYADYVEYGRKPKKNRDLYHFFRFFQKRKGFTVALSNWLVDYIYR
jgi:hypothetical protein